MLIYISKDKIYKILEVLNFVVLELHSSIWLKNKELEELLLQVQVIMLKELHIVVTSLK